MISKRVSGWVLALVLVTATAHAGIDIQFVDGLAARGYYPLAIEHLNRMRTAAGVDAEDKALIPLKLGLITGQLAELTPDPARREALFKDASTNLDEFAKANPESPQMLDVSLKQIDIQSSLATTAQMRYEAETDKTKKDAIRKEIEGLYQKGLDAAKALISQTDGPEQKARPRYLSNPKNEKYLQEFWHYYGAQVRGMFMLGHIEYLWAQLYPPKDPERKKHLDEAVKRFDETTAKNPKSNVTFLSHVRRGMCLRERAPFEKTPKDVNKTYDDAIKAFDAALTVQSNPTTKPIRAEAHYEKAVTAMIRGEFEAAKAGADGFITESPEGKSSYRGQQALLIRARALGMLADRQRKMKPDENQEQANWEETLADAKQTLRDISPQFREIRKEADELVQEWMKMFPEKSEVVLSPLIAASQAKQNMESGKLDAAIDKYNEVVNLSEGREAFRTYEQEAWKSLGAIYLNQKRLLMTVIAWRELLTRFPQTAQGEEIAWKSAEIWAYLHTVSKTKDGYYLDGYLDSLKFFIALFPKDKKVFEAQTEIANVYAIKDQVLESAKIWAATDPDNPRYAEAMLNAGELYRKAFIALADEGKGDTPEAKAHLDACIDFLKKASGAALPADAAENYNAKALVNTAELLVDKAVPKSYASQVPAVLDTFRERFPDDRLLMPRMLLAAARALATMARPLDAEKLALEMEKDYPESDSFGMAVQLMVVAFQRTDPVRANAWAAKQIDIGGDMTKVSEQKLANFATRSLNQKQYDPAIQAYTELTKRYRAKTDDEGRAKFREYEEGLAKAFFESARYAQAVPIYRGYLDEARKAYDAQDTDGTRSKFLGALMRVAECEEMGGDARKAIELWTEFSGKTFRQPKPPEEWFMAQVHLANCHMKTGEFSAAGRILRRVELFYGGFKEYPELQKQVDEIRKKIR